MTKNNLQKEKMKRVLKIKNVNDAKNNKMGDTRRKKEKL